MIGKVENYHLNRWWCLVGVFALAFIIRITFILIYPGIPIATDTSDYVGVAESVLAGNGFPDVENPPLYPLFLAGIFLFFGENYLIVRVIQALINSLTCVLIYLLGKRVFNEKVGFWSALAVAFYPFHIWFTGMIVTEILFSFLITLFILVLLKALKSSSYKDYIIAGILLGMSALCRPTVLAFPIFVLVAMLVMLRSCNVRFILMRFSAFLFLFLLTLSLWTIWNYTKYHKIIPVTTQAGHALYSSLYELEVVNNAKIRSQVRENVNEVIHKTSDPIEQNDTFFRMALKKIKQNPMEFVKDSIIKSFMFWYATSSGERQWEILLLQMLILIPAIIGVAFASTKDRQTEIIPLVLIIAYFVAVHSIFLPRIRHALVVMPFVIVFAVFGIQKIFKSTAPQPLNMQERL